MISSPIAARLMVEPPPRLDVLSEMPQDGLHRSSTFRACLEKAVEDINDKYGASSASCLPDSRTHETSNGNHATNSHPDLHHARSNFQPRYRLPTFVHVPLVRTRPTFGEVKDISPCPSNEINRQGQAPDGSLSVERQIDEILCQAFDTTSSPGAAPADELPHRLQEHDDSLFEMSSSLAMLSSPPSVAVEKNEPESDINERPSLKTAGYISAEQDAKTIDTQLPTLSNAGSTSGTFHRGLDDGTLCLKHAREKHTDANSIHLEDQQKPSLPTFEAPSDFSALTLKRIRRPPGNSEVCTKAGFVPLKRTGAQGGMSSTGKHEQRAPSVSELVNKFRLMASPPNDTGRDGPAEDGEAKMVGTCRSRFFDDSEDDSAVFSYSDDAGTSIYPMVSQTARCVTSTNGSGDDGPRLVREIE